MAFRSVVRVYDWDGDGLADLVCSSDTNVCWFKNINTNPHSEPVLLAAVDLKAPLPSGALVPINPIGGIGARLRVFPVDWNNDGVPDLLLGYADGKVLLYEGYRFAFTRCAPQPDGALVFQWKSAPYLKYQLRAKDSLDDPSWMTVTNFPSGGTTTTGTNALRTNHRFFQLRISE